MILSSHRVTSVLLCLSALTACGGSTPPPKTEESARPEPTRTERRGGASVSQELGSIDQSAVEQTFQRLQGKLESCHAQGRGRVEYLSGDVKIFLRIDTAGKVKYSYFEESTIGDRDTEKCLLDLFAATDWPKPEGGEAEVRNGFGWAAGGERPPTPWGSEKVMTALDADTEVKKSLDACKAGVVGDFRVTAYVEPGEVEGAHGSGNGAGKGSGKGGHKGTHEGGKKGAKAKDGEHGGRFKAIGVAPPDQAGAEKVDCVVDALRALPLPSPGSYAAKVTFAL